MWLVEFFGGVLLAYLILSPRLRHLIFKVIRPIHIEYRINKEYKAESNKPISFEPLTKTESSDVLVPRNTHGKVLTSEDEVLNWLRANPELRQRNGIKD